MDHSQNNTSSQSALAEAAASVGASDVFVFRRVTEDRFVHVGGFGRGEGWAGNVDLIVSDDSFARTAVETGEPVRVEADQPVHVFGPYYQRFAALVPISTDVIVVFGRDDLGAFGASDARIFGAGVAAAGAVERVSLAKRLADELEVLHAVRGLIQTDARSLPDVMQHVAETAAAALSCELGILYMRERDALAIADLGSPVALDGRSAVPELRALSTRLDELPSCIQEAATRPLPEALGAGVTSYYLLPVGTPPMALLALFHTEVQPRGFTLLCREVGSKLAEAAEPLLRTALTVQELEGELDRAGRDARIDPLTGLHNRRAWDEAVARRSGDEPTGVIMLDVDGLKSANDRRGHHFGDEVLRAIAGVLRVNVREDDFIARLGGDEVAVLLPYADEESCREVAGRLDAALRHHTGLGGFQLAASMGWAASPPAPTVAKAESLADERMYARKRLRGGGRSPAAVS